MHVHNPLAKRLIALFCAFFISFVSLAALVPDQTKALTGNKTLDVKQIKQEKSNWCWAACSEMAGRYICGYPFLGIGYRSQSDIVKYVKGSTADLPGSLADSAKGSKYASKDKYTYYYESKVWSWSDLRGEIDNNRTVQLGAGYYENQIRRGGHMVILTGWTFNSSSNRYYIYYNDPWDGTQQFCEYSAFLDGSFNGRKYDQTVYYR